MKKILITIPIILFFSVVKAQVNGVKATDTTSKTYDVAITTVDGNGKVFTSVEHEPEFKGGLQEFYKYLRDSIHYPANAVKNHIEGRVFLSFIVEKDGSLSNIKIVRSVSEDIDSEAIRVLKDSPVWNPGLQNGKPVRVSYVMPLDFRLSKG